MQFTSLKTKPIDRRRLNMYDRSQYNPMNRLGALQKARAFRANYAYDKKRKPFATEQSPGTGGFTRGLDMQSERLFNVGAAKERAESFRPEKLVSSEIYDKLS